ncbi:tail fiber protein [uncultured Gimesia sp.]|uniref:phage tail protein n=1 Tax=uncultured Gimesia sp. TaxID=1678688 RepID=UPI0026341809|nr:tail fiber protein [uncultured Gimesia sp.]
MVEPYIGQISAVGFNFAPRGWAKCEGQLLPIAQNSALFSLLGTQYGGDGRTTFGLPDLRGRAPIHHGTGPGLENVKIGTKSGGDQSLEKSKESGPKTQPTLAVTWVIALRGVYPSRN